MMLVADAACYSLGQWGRCCVERTSSSCSPPSAYIHYSNKVTHIYAVWKY